MSQGLGDLPLHLQQKKQQLRNALRQEYWKKITQPPKAPKDFDMIFDPAHQRYFSMAATKYHFFRPNYWNGFWFFAIVIAPIAGFSYLFKSDRDKREALIRSGQIAYKDRLFKLN